MSSKTMLNFGFEKEKMREFIVLMLAYLGLLWLNRIELDLRNSLGCPALHQPPLFQEDLTSNLKAIKTVFYILT